MADSVWGFFLSRGRKFAGHDTPNLATGAGFAVECPRCSALVIDEDKHARICQ